MKHIALLALAAALAMPAAAGAWGDQCRKLYRLTDLDHAIEPGVLVAATDQTPNHCRVRGVVNRAIRFEVTMPVDMCVENPTESCGAWNERLMFTAVGGNAGNIGDTTSLLARGFAMASTDTGHEAADGSAFLAQPEALLDFAYRGVHLATQAAKRVVEHFYQEKISYSYLQGCSNGGRAAMLSALRFPANYDGIIAGAPAFRYQEFLPWMIAMHRAQTANPLTVDALRVLDNASRSACDALDGVEGRRDRRPTPMHRGRVRSRRARLLRRPGRGLPDPRPDRNRSRRVWRSGGCRRQRCLSRSTSRRRGGWRLDAVDASYRAIGRQLHHQPDRRRLEATQAPRRHLRSSRLRPQSPIAPR